MNLKSETDCRQSSNPLKRQKTHFLIDEVFNSAEPDLTNSLFEFYKYYNTMILYSDLPGKREYNDESFHLPRLRLKNELGCCLSFM